MSDNQKLSDLTLDEKATVGSGENMWSTKHVGPIDPIVLVDGPHGVRKPIAEGGAAIAVDTQPATCFPPAVALAQTWSTAIAEQVGEALGRECRAMGVDVLLGPGLNIKRDPRCGRNFEYFSEDPLLTGALGTAWVKGLQSNGVGASLKHFAANNAETDRMRASSEVDARTLREIYLRGFERVVRQARPWTVMCSYNRINGVYASENHWLLTEVLCNEWGFDGLVVSDWGAVSDRVAAVAAGLDLEMPGGSGESDAAVAAAVRAGTLSEDAVDRAAHRIGRLSTRSQRRQDDESSFDVDAHHDLAREVAGHAIVLLKNHGELLPLTEGSIAVIGEFAQKPVYQGGGSSHVTSTRLDAPLEEIRRLAENRVVTYAPGFAAGKAHDSDLHDEAVRHASNADTAIVFLGLPPGAESEGWDREHIDLPEEQLTLLRAVSAVQPRTVAVLSHGGVIASGAVAESAAAVLDGALLGQAGGSALAEVLFGVRNPSGRLAETVPLRLQDAPSYLNFPAEGGRVVYGERIFVGYRGYDALDRDVAFPFGYGLSYTEFRYTDLVITPVRDGFDVAVTVANVGTREGRDVIQIYAHKADSAVARPPRWLVGFGDVTLAPDEEVTCTIRVGLDELKYWDVRRDEWVLEGGHYALSVGASSRDLKLSGALSIAGDESRLPLTLESTLGEVLADPAAGPAFAHFADTSELPAGVLGTDILGLVGQIPIGRLAAFSGGALSREDLLGLLNQPGPDHAQQSQHDKLDAPEGGIA